MVAEPWILRMGNQVSSNLKQALLLEPYSSGKKKCINKQKQTLGILSFEVANVMSKTVHLYKSLADSEISKLKTEIVSSEGVINLVSPDEQRLSELAVAEKLEELDRIAGVVSRLGRKCNVPALQGFEHVYGDIVNGVIDVRALGFLVKDMDAMVKKMERYVQTTSSLYGNLEMLNEMERAGKKFQQNQLEESRRAFEQKLVWQKHEVSHLKNISLWDQNFDKVVELLARTVCTIYAKICVAFGDSASKSKGLRPHSGNSPSLSHKLQQNSGATDVHSLQLKRVHSKSSVCNSDDMDRLAVKKRGAQVRNHTGVEGFDVAPFRPDDLRLPCGTIPSRLFLDCLSISSSAAKIDDDFVDQDNTYSRNSEPCSTVSDFKREQVHLRSGFCNHYPLSGLLSTVDGIQSKCSSTNGTQFGHRSRLAAFASPSTIGGSALALHYANVIIVIEKLLRYPHLVGKEASDDLYQMLPTTLRKSLRAKLKAYVKSLAIYDAPLAHDWKETLDGILRWLAPLAHNMIRWQSERNFEQQQIVTRTNVLLLQTLYFANREKTEAAICELLVGLNYICRYEHQQNALLDCASSFDFDDCSGWHLEQ